MLAFFPTPYPDELLYGACARFHFRSDSDSCKGTIRSLFGRSSACAVVDLPNGLDYLASQVPGHGAMTPEILIDQNTLLPMYRPFLPAPRLNQLVSRMKSSSCGGSIHTAIGAMASGIPSPRFLRLCPQCLKEDTARYGEPYWHRAHQVPGVLVCHIHGSWLLETNIDPSGKKHVFYVVPDVIACEGSSLEAAVDVSHCIAIARAAAWLLNSPPDLVPGLISLQKKYLYYLQEQGFVTYSGRIKQKALHEAFAAFYGPILLQVSHSPVDPHMAESWLSSLVRKPRKTTHPLRHILLMHFLGLGPERLFHNSIHEHMPFGRGPWPCLNPAADHFGERVIKDCTISRNSENGKPVGNFFCSCGFSYARTGPDLAKDDRGRIGRMLSFGPVWEKKLLDLTLVDRKGLREAARLLGVDTNTIKKHLRRLTGEQLEQEAGGSLQCDERSNRRRRWLELKEACPEAGRTDLRKLAPAIYTWLYRHDRQWLEKHLPAKKQVVYVNRRVNWPERDKALAMSVASAAAAIRGQIGKPVRVTISSIGKKIGSLMLLQKKLGKLPLTEECLGQVCETIDDFQISPRPRLRRCFVEE